MMSDEKIKVSPSPIQRNILDVATELTLFHFQNFHFDNKDDIKKVFAEYYSLVAHLERTRSGKPDKLKEFLPESIIENLY